MEERIIEFKFERKEWIKLNFSIGYRSILVIYMTLIGFGMLYAVIDYLSWNLFNTAEFPIWHLLMAIFILLVLPISTYLNAAKNFKSNPWVYERVRFELDSSKVLVKGETYELSVDWANFKSIKEYKDWFVFYTETNRGLFIPKRVFKSNEEVDSFRKDLKTRPVAKKKL